MVIALALLNVFTLGAGAAVAGLMPAQLAKWNVPRVAVRPLSAAGQVLPGVTAAAPVPTSRGLATALSGLMSSASLGSQTGVVISDPASGRVLYASGAAAMLQP